MIELVPVRTRRELKEFNMLPFRLYKDDPNWVPPLIGEQKKFFDPRHNAFYEHSEAELFLARKDGRTVGRISAHTNTRHNKEHKDRVGFFGFFECENEQEVADQLLARALEWNRAHGRDAMRGPFNFTINAECGLLVDGFDTPPMIMMRHDKPYYARLLENSGFHKAMDMYAYLSVRTEIPERIDKIAALIEKRTRVKIRSLSKDKNQRMKDIGTVFEVYTEAWQYNWGYVPLSEGEFHNLADELLPVADPELIFIAEIDGRPVGFCLAMPNYNEVLKVMGGRVNPLTMLKAMRAKKKIGSARVVTMGIVREFQQRGIDTLFYYYAYKNGLPKGLFRGEFSWVLENNTMMIRVAEMLDAQVYKTYRIYEKDIIPAR
jgi:GNAT superfamily N-acetyltransferase